MPNYEPLNIPKLNAKQIATVVVQSGWFGQTDQANAATAIAIALAESSGNPNAKNGEHYGLWQISYNAHKELFKPDSPDWSPYNPYNNVAMAAQVYRKAGNSFTPWTVYKSGAYKKYMQEASAGLTGRAESLAAANEEVADSSALDAGITNVTDAAGSIVNALDPRNWLAWLANALVNVGVFVFAVVLLVVGIWLLIPKDVKSAVPLPVPVK